LRAEGWDIDIKAHHRRGGMILGVCGGYQMLGCSIADPDGIEGPAGSIAGLGLLDVATALSPHKALRSVEGLAMGAPFSGYEMHMGETEGPDCARPFATLEEGEADGAVSADGRVLGTYVHGVLSSPTLRAALLRQLGARSDGLDYDATVDAALDEVAGCLERHLDIDALAALAERNAS
jgi:adenosylcobyric acid synthase